MYTLEEYFYFVSYVILSIIAIIPNAYVVRLIWKRPELRTPTFIFIANQSMSDVLFGTLTMIQLLLCRQVFVEQNRVAKLICELNYWLVLTTLVLSINFILLISIERCLSLWFPLRFKGLNAKNWSIFTWIKMLTFMFVYTIDSDILEVSSAGKFMFTCFSAFPELSNNWFIELDIPYKFIIIVEGLLNGIITLTCGILIVFKIYMLPSTSLEQTDQKRRNAIKLTLIIILGYVIFTTPTYFVQFENVFKHWTTKARYQCPSSEIDFRFPFYPLHYIWLMSRIACLVNPISLFIFNNQFKSELLTVIKSSINGTAITESTMDARSNSIIIMTNWFRLVIKNCRSTLIVKLHYQYLNVNVIDKCNFDGKSTFTSFSYVWNDFFTGFRIKLGLKTNISV